MKGLDLKRVFDIIVACLLIVALAPVMLLIYLKVRSDGGGAIFTHERIGKGGVVFGCYKFRSMVLDSKEVLEALLASDECARDEWSQTFKLKNDPRVNGFGRFLRGSSLDELPQLFNVLKGEMSLVGPRPIVVDEVVKYKDCFEFYCSVLPGITGLWQISGRNDISYDERVELDKFYVQNKNLLMDISILIKTVGIVLCRKGAY